MSMATLFLGRSGISARTLSTSARRTPKIIDHANILSRSIASNPPFEKILIANRGEIACRVIDTAKRMGIRTVAVYSDADAMSKHVRIADERVNIGPPPSRESYLNVPAILDAIQSTGAQGVHPGYGFLSENASFSQACADIGVAFIGPDGSAMEAMGDKLMSKKIAHEAGVSTIPGFKGEITDADHAVQIAREVGYPVMIKASAGGGGKGMRVAWNDDEVVEGFRLSIEEARSSFGDDRMLIEKFIEDPHHIEINIVADKHGNIAAFPERECSIQRRNQKVIEESPSVMIDPDTRLAMQEQAMALARGVNYHSAGTVEMLCDPQKNFYFLEMNTRLQVEHCVTEEVTGVDLVEQMINVAAGLPLSIPSGPVSYQGWSMETRVYAEDPLRGFLPSTGPLVKYIEPKVYDHSENKKAVRIDTGVNAGSNISMFYDPLISKVITYGDTRNQAIDRMNKALDQYVIQGLNHNICFARDVLRHPKFLEGDTTTKFVEEQYPDGFRGCVLTEQERNHLISAAAIMHTQRVYLSQTIDGQLESHAPEDPTSMVVVLGGPKGVPYKVDWHEDGHVTIEPKDHSASPVRVEVNDMDWKMEQPLFQAHMDGEERIVQYLGKKDFETYNMVYCGSPIEVIVRSHVEHEMQTHMLPPIEIDTSKFLLCPMPGVVIDVLVEPGEQVEAGQDIAVVEAMKMQNMLKAEKRCTIKKVNCSVGDALPVDHIMIEFE
mmetsp:Transcript_61/g.129  ORF Transcript_61/g.129 Transcript_61/m.129 type:complete len:721 (+) Transcript_61:37-2199(+)|eukprot:CAMPEP_0117790930 /NCGR_PEP_ID=MMETSP0948-20121206/8561_1 /TAXON_ID=44440 /ORGANISM="Chattonella subsalsa, Strain CCMP2191" /LENGTH=720 /DNA_ID=CAMNT_0005620899 /DNA_START=8 /DNA_END=2170 /DNA_ORIENTATION=-